MKYAVSVLAILLSMAVFAQSEWTGAFRDPERVVAAISANPRAVALWLDANVSQAKCRDLESVICPSLSKEEKAKAARAARMEAERAGAGADVLSALDVVISITESAVSIDAGKGK